MGNIITIARKELSIYFTTVTGYLVFGLHSFVMGLIFVSFLNQFQTFTEQYLAMQRPELLEQLNFNDSIITPMLTVGIWLFLFWAPLLTMRLFAEEKSNRTFELLMTAPTTSFQLVLGKFVGVAGVVILLTFMPLIFPVILHFYGVGTGGGSGVEWTPIMSGCLSVLMFGLLFSAIGLLITSLTESQIVAAVITFAALLLLFLLSMLASRIEGDWRGVIEYLGPLTHVRQGLKGRLMLSDLTYFGSAILLFLFLTLRSVESHRWR